MDPDFFPFGILSAFANAGTIARIWRIILILAIAVTAWIIWTQF